MAGEYEYMGRRKKVVPIGGGLGMKMPDMPSLIVVPDPVKNVIKMDHSEIREYFNEMSSFLKQPGSVALRLCECCIDVS